MRQQMDNYCFSDENSILLFAAYSDIGDREEQQDCAGYELSPEGGIFIVCDGMGGHNGGKIAGQTAVDCFFEKCKQAPSDISVEEMLLEAVIASDKEVSGLSDANGAKLRAGSTAVATVIKNNSLYWISVGDSRIYLVRDGQIVQVTEDHNYYLMLNHKLTSGEISQQQYDAEKVKGHALISFLGIDGLPYINRNDTPFEVKSGDSILMTSDGLYKLITAEEICGILSATQNANDAVQSLVIKARRAAKTTSQKRDNITLSLIKIK